MKIGTAFLIGVLFGCACCIVGTQSGIARAHERNSAELQKAAGIIRALRARCWI